MTVEEALDILADIVFSDPYPHGQEKADKAIAVLQEFVKLIQDKRC